MTPPVTPFLDLHYAPAGGGLASQVNFVQASSLADYASLPLSTLQGGIRGRHVLIATHGFNVNRADGIACLANWGGLHRPALAGRLRLGARSRLS